MKENLIGTRVFDKILPEKYNELLNPFLENSEVFGSCLIVSQKEYEHLQQLIDHIDGKADIRLSETKGNESPADMCNQIVNYCAERNLTHFGIVSSDLSKHIPRVMPEMLDRLKSNPDLTTLGVAIEGVHNMELLKLVADKGKQEINTENYATVFHNNAFSVQRLFIPGVPLEQRLFPRESDQFRLGVVKVENKEVPVGGNEEIALMLKLLSQKIFMNVELLVGRHTIVRDSEKEVSSIRAKVERRSLVARVFQEHFGVSDEDLKSYLDKHYTLRY